MSILNFLPNQMKFHNLCIGFFLLPSWLLLAGWLSPQWLSSVIELDLIVIILTAVVVRGDNHAITVHHRSRPHKASRSGSSRPTTDGRVCPFIYRTQVAVINDQKIQNFPFSFSPRLSLLFFKSWPFPIPGPSESLRSAAKTRLTSLPEPSSSSFCQWLPHAGS